MRVTQRTLIICFAATAACAGAPTRAAFELPAPHPREVSLAPRGGTSDTACAECAANDLSDDVRQALLARIDDLKERGGSCAAYGDVLERTLTERRITVKPYMWRVGRSLASGEARPNGEMTLARDIDSLNVGVRTLRDLVWSIEHEAVHIALGIPSGVDSHEWRVDGVVRSCRTADRRP